MTSSPLLQIFSDSCAPSIFEERIYIENAGLGMVVDNFVLLLYHNCYDSNNSNHE